jgi:hypothetical protein
MSKALKALVAGLFAALAFATPAAADPGNGAQALSYDYCQQDGPTTFCAHGHSVYQTTETPSGNIIVQLNDRYYYSFTGPDCNYNNTGQDHSHARFTADGSETSHAVQAFDFNQSCFGITEHCTFIHNVSFVHGELHVVKDEYVCEPV